jgi:hypothetical protein
MANLKHEFISKENRQYKVRLGKDLATPLSGFVAGAVVASMVWVFMLVYIYM